MSLVTLHCIINTDSGKIESITQTELSKKMLPGEQVQHSYNEMIDFSETQTLLKEKDISRYQKKINILQNTVVEMQQRVDETDSLISTCVHESMNNYSQNIVQKYSNEHNASLKTILSRMFDLERQYSTSLTSKSTKQVGAEGEQFIIQTIQQLYPQWCIEDTHGAAEAGDFHSFVDRDSGVWILNEVKTHKSSIRTAEVKKFYRDIDKHTPPMAIMYSLHSNIVDKPHGHYEKRNNTHIYFISYVQNNPQSIDFLHRILLRQWKESKGVAPVLPTHNKEEEEKETETRLKVLIATNREKHIEVNNCIEFMLNRDKVLISQCNREISQHKTCIKQKSNIVRDTEKHMKEYTKRQFELEVFKNEDESSQDKYPYFCNRCQKHFLTKSKLLKHISSQSHLNC